jgi:hypothetical protein
MGDPGLVIPFLLDFLSCPYWFPPSRVTKTQRAIVVEEDPELEKFLLVWGLTPGSTSPKLLQQWCQTYSYEKCKNVFSQAQKTRSSKLTLAQHRDKRSVLDRCSSFGSSYSRVGSYHLGMREHRADVQ